MNPDTHVNPAAAALGVSGPAPSLWSIQGIVTQSINRYNSQEQEAARQKEAGQTLHAQLCYAIAYENARFLAAYYQARAESDLYAVWSRREMRAHLQAFNLRNVVAEAIQGGRAADNLVSEDDEDDDD